MKKSVLFTALICFFTMSFAFGQAIPSPGFETWTTHGSGNLTYPVPNGWSTIDSFGASLVSVVGFVKKDSINPHSGNYDIQLQNKLVSGIFVVPGIACSGVMNLISVSPFKYTITGGFPATSISDSIRGWYRDSLSGPADTSYIVAFYTKWDTTLHKRDTVAFGGMKIDTSQLTWKRFAFVILNDSFPNVAPDSGMVVLYSGNGVTGTNGTTLWVDDLASTVGIDQIDPLNSNYDLYPNPVAGTLNVKNNNFIRKNAVMNVYDELGRNAVSYNLNDNLTVVNTSGLSSGIYFYQIISANKTIYKKGKFIVQ
jgi:hypothetical protein